MELIDMDGAINITQDEKKITVAAIVPVFNGEKFISEAIDSIIRQTRPVDEIIVVLDGSSDQSEDIIKSSFQNHNIRVLKKNNGGQSSARNFGIQHAQSSHIAFLDQDDVWHADHIQELIAPFETNSNLSVSYGNLDRIDERGFVIDRRFLKNFNTPHPKTSLADCLSHDMFIVPGATMIAKQAFKSVGGFDEQLSGYEDDDLFLRLFLNHHEFYYTDTAVTMWRIYSSSTSYSELMSNSRMIYFRKIIEMFPDDPLLNNYWTRDIIVPRFLSCILGQVLVLSNVNDLKGMKRHWRDAKEILPLGEWSETRKVRRGARVMDFLLASGMVSLARSWLKDGML